MAEDFPKATVADLQAARELRIEAEAIEAMHGPNPYSNYLRKHGKCPTRAEASVIGRVMGGRVRADNGSLQPLQSAAERKAIRLQREAFARRCEQETKIKSAVAALAEIAADPANAVQVENLLSNSPEILAQAESAVSLLIRITERWHEQQQKASPEKLGTHC